MSNCKLTAREQKGFTLLELVVAVSLGATLFAILGNVMIGTTRSVDYIVTDMVTVQDIRDGVTGIGGELRRSAATSITIVSGSQNDTLTLQVSAANGSGSTMGAEDQSGNFNTGWFIRYRVVGTDLIREVLNAGGLPASSHIIARHVSDQGGVKGLAVTQNGALYTVRIQINTEFDDGNDYTKDMQSTVFVRN
jgi:prepilin-type N-terminal cleavage/methylation domain-containing protein